MKKIITTVVFAILVLGLRLALEFLALYCLINSTKAFGINTDGVLFLYGFGRFLPMALKTKFKFDFNIKM